MFQKLKNIFHIFECIFADIFFGYPAKNIILIGITGTDGKTTTSHILYQILSANIYKVALVSSVYADIGNVKYETGLHTTTPRPWLVRSFIHKAVKAGCSHFILETTSHAIEQNRIWGLAFSYGVLTNITQDHLYHHKTIKNYINIKMKLLLQAKTAIVNSQCSQFNKCRDILKGANRKFYTYALKGKADFVWRDDIKTNLVGDYNKQNILAAYACASLLGISDDKIKTTVHKLTSPIGRLDIVYNKNFKIFIDFAHTPNSIENVLKTIRKQYHKDNGKIIHVFGAASQRDDLKRPLMGKASCLYSNIIILTEEDYRSENFTNICMQIEKGITGFKKVQSSKLDKMSVEKLYTCIKNREEAIKKAIQIARKGDIVVLTGKSHEKSLNREGKEYPWDEYNAVRNAIKKLR